MRHFTKRDLHRALNRLPKSGLKENFTHFVYHDPVRKAAVATNGFLMVYAPHLYDETLAGKLISKKGNEPTYGHFKYPNYARIIPGGDLNHYSENTETLPADFLTYKEKIVDGYFYFMQDGHVHRIEEKYVKFIEELGFDGWRHNDSRTIIAKEFEDGSLVIVSTPVIKHVPSNII